MKTVSKEAAQVIAAAVSKKLAADKATTAVVDALHADGVTPAMMMAPKNGEDRTFYGSLEGAVIAGFTVTVQGLLQKETKTLTEQQKSDKRYWKQRIGATIGDFRKALQRRIDKQNAEGESNGANNTSTLESRILRDFGKYIAQVEKVEKFSGNVVEFLKCAKSALVHVKG